MARGPLDLWNAWATQILVLLSLTLQILLLMFAGIRRRKSSVVLRFILWLAYLLADSTAIYAVGHLSLSSAPREHKLVAFWAPFLLLHLGGPDNITAYSLEDNKLWKRHLVTLVVQVLGVEYVLYKNIMGSGGSIVVASILMFIIGTAKYGERTWALYRANFSIIRSALKEIPRSQLRGYQGYLREEDKHFDASSDEFLLQRAHSLFHICERGIVDSVIEVDKTETETKRIIKKMTKNPGRMWRMMEIELSLMYDILYTKARVIHTMVGYCVRAVSPFAVLASFLLFHFSGKHGHSEIDITITYILHGGALLIETTSTLNAVGSSWALSYLCTTQWSGLRHAALCAGRWHRLRHAVVTVRQFIRTITGGSASYYGRSRMWSGTIGQFNMLYFRAAQVNKTSNWFSNLAEKLGFDDWWDMYCYSWTETIPEEVKRRAEGMISTRDLNTMGMLRNNWGMLALDSDKRPGLYNKFKRWHGVDFHESIISWHIATDMFLIRRERDRSGAAFHGSADEPVVLTIRILSNYLLFLLVKQPDMLPGLPQNWLYQRTCDNLDEICEEKRDSLLEKLPGGHHDDPKSSWLKHTDVLAGILLEQEDKHSFDSSVPRLTYARHIADTLFNDLEDADAVDVLFDLWTDFLLHAANRCSRESHAKKLNSGSEFTTVLWLMIEHLYQIKQ